MNDKTAIIDLGSNSARVIIMQLFEDGSYKMIDQGKAVVLLSEGMAADLNLRSTAMARAIEVLKLFKKLIESHKVEKVFAIATAAVRNSRNGGQFLNLVKSETGFDFTIISGAEESYYDYLGVINTIDIKDCVIVDTGGGSTEIVLVKNRRVSHAISLPYGAVVLTEKFLTSGDESKLGLKAAETFIRGKIRALKWLDAAKGLPVIGLGGSIRNLAKIHKNTNGFIIDGLHNYRIPAVDVGIIYDKISGLKVNDRKKLLGLSKDRASIIAGGLVPVSLIMEYIASEQLIISGSGLREGVFYKNFHLACGMEREIVDDVLEHSLLNTMMKYESNIPHGRQVQMLALSMFDQLKDLHGLDDRYRRQLYVGSLLHDIGLYVDYYNHHNHGFYLATNSGINGLSHRDQLICGYIIALHRNEDFNKSWKDYSLYMDQNDYEAIRKLGMFVRISEALDRNEYGHVEKIQCTVEQDQIKIILSARRVADLEIAAANLSGKAFKKVFGKKLVFESKV